MSLDRIEKLVERRTEQLKRRGVLEILPLVGHGGLSFGEYMDINEEICLENRDRIYNSGDWLLGGLLKTRDSWRESFFCSLHRTVSLDLERGYQDYIPRTFGLAS